MATTHDTVTERVTIQGTPDAPDQTLDLTTSLLREYVSGSPYATVANFLRVLPWNSDDLTADFTDQIYDKMLLDSEVQASVNTLKSGVLSSALDIVSAADDETDADYALANEIRDHCERSIQRITPSMTDVLWNMLDAAPYGNRVAEQVYEYLTTGPDAGRYVLKALKVKPRHATAFVVDAFKNVVGLAAVQPGRSPSISVGAFLVGAGERANETLLPREKFAILTHRPKDGDPRGTSILRAAYTPWSIKTQLIPEWVKYMSIYASPATIGYVDPASKNQIVKDVHGTPTGQILTPQEAMFAALAQLRNSFTGAFSAGSKVDTLEARGDGKAFDAMFDRCDQWIAKAVLNQELATGEGQHDSRAAATVHANILALIIKHLKIAVAEMIKRDVFMNLVRINFGEDKLHLTPDASFGEVEEGDAAAMLTGVAAMETAGYFDPSQYAALDALLNLPPRSPEDVAARATRAATPPPVAPVALPVPDNVTPIARGAP